MDKLENGMIVFIPELEKIRFDMLYNRFFDITDTQKLIENISIESLETFLYHTAKYFYGYRSKKEV